MGMIVIALMVALAFLSYQLGKSHRENIKQAQTLREPNRYEPPVPPVTPRVRQKPVKPPEPPPPLPRPVEGRFVQVIFKKGSRKRYDYLIGNVCGLKVNDFVLVPIHKSKERLDKETQRMLIEVELTGKQGEKPRKTTCLRAKVMRISEPGETSQYARSAVIKKLDQKKW